MWWLIPVGLGVGLIALLNAGASESERAAAARWRENQGRAKRSVEEHRQNIERNLRAAQASYDFRVLVDLHHSSFRVADEAYKLLADSRTALNAYRRMIGELKEGRRVAARDLRITMDPATHRDAVTRVETATSFLDQIYPTMEATRVETEALKDELGRLNTQTRILKEAIRDRCGSRGRQWYDRLEARAAARRLSRG